MTHRHLLDDRDLTQEDRLALLERAFRFKHEGLRSTALRDQNIALVMTKPSLRTRVSFTVAVRRLGGNVVEVGPQNTKLGHGEDLVEWAGVLGRMTDVIVARVHAHEDLEGLAEHSGVRVVNALSDRLHPCQALADFFTLWERARLRAPGLSAKTYFSRPPKLAYVGDGNNVAHSLMLAAASLGVPIALACPEGRGPSAELVEAARALHPHGTSGVEVGSDPRSAVREAAAVYTDTWISMGQEGASDPHAIAELFAPYRVDDALLSHAADDAVFLHCLPAEPEREVTTSVLRGPRSLVLTQAENRLFTAMAVLDPP